MALWALLLLLGIVCLFVGMVQTFGRSPDPSGGGTVITPEARVLDSVPIYNDSRPPGEIAVLPNVVLPAQWNESSIMRQLQQLRDEKPALIPHFVESIKERWIIHQDDRTAQVRLQFLKTQIDQLKLWKELRQTTDDIDLLLLEKAKRVKTLELETQEIDVKKRSLTRKEELEAVKEQKQMELEIAQLEKQIADLKNPSKPEPQLTAEQQRKNDRVACEARIQTLKEEKQKALSIDDPAERVMRVNALDDAIQREYERWSKLV